MRGKKDLEPKIFYDFSLEKIIPEDDPHRRLDAILDLSFVEALTRGLYGYNGNKSVDPVVVVKVLLLGYLNNIRSIRQLMRQINVNLAFRWFIRYDIDESIPDHSAISKNLKRFGADLFQELFDRTVKQCQRAGLVGGELVHVDSTPIQADASDDSVKPVPPDDTFCPNLSPNEYWDKVSDEIKKDHPRVNDRMASNTDPDAGILSRDGNGRQLAFKDHRMIDDRFGVILATRATGAQITDNHQFIPLMQELIFGQSIIPEAVAADTIYGKAENYKELLTKGIKAFIPRKRPARSKGMFGKEQFTYIPDQDAYVCPAGEILRPQSKLQTCWRVFRASGPVCAACCLRSQCTKGKGPRTIRRHVDEAFVEQALTFKDSKSFKKALKRRQTLVEGSFGNAKELHTHRRARWRGLMKMQVQCYLVAAVQNLKKLLKYGYGNVSTGVGKARYRPNSLVIYLKMISMTRQNKLIRFSSPLRTFNKPASVSWVNQLHLN